MTTTILADIRSAGRTLIRERAFVALAVFTLALGIGSTAAVFGMVNQLLLRPLPGVHADAGAGYLHLSSVSDPERRQGLSISTLDFDEVRREASLLDGLASYDRAGVTVEVPGRRAIAATANAIYGDFFEILGVRAAEGRMLRSSETDLLASPLVAIISEELRSTLFGPT
jgi:hypothetical protein